MQEYNNQCWTFTKSLYENNNPMVFRVDLLETYFVHAILLVQSISDVKGFGDYKIHVGDSAEDKN